MADLVEIWRSNYFKVKDRAAFEAALKCLDIKVTNKTGEETTVCLLPHPNCDDGFPTQYFDDDKDDYIDFNWEALFKEHLQENQVAVIQNVGFEKLRYLVGYAIAYNHEGDSIFVSLEDIYSQIPEIWGDEVECTDCSY